MSQNSLAQIISHAGAVGRPVISLEFFPPKKAENLPKTRDLIRLLSEFPIDFMTVTYGAGGSTRSFTKDLAVYIHTVLKRRVVSHLTCVNHSKEELKALVQSLFQEGITDILALRGDAPAQIDEDASKVEAFTCARDLISFLKVQGARSICAAGYPEVHRDAASPEADLAYLKEKVDAGAEVILTQLFFDAKVYFDFVAQCRSIGILVPIMPGVMPIRDYHQLQKFTGLCGASIPASVREHLDKIKENPAQVIEYGTRHAIALCKELIAKGAPGIHLYTLNQSDQVLKILAALLP